MGRRDWMLVWTDTSEGWHFDGDRGNLTPHYWVPLRGAPPQPYCCSTFASRSQTPVLLVAMG